MTAIASRIASEFPDTNSGWGAGVESVREELVATSVEPVCAWRASAGKFFES